MKIFISHKFRGENKAELKKRIEKISAVLEKNGYQTFNYFRDRENWRTGNYSLGRVIREAFREIRKCDAVLGFIDKQEPSEGMLLEFGFAKALKKKTILVVSDNCSLPTLEAITDKVIKVKSLLDVQRLTTILLL